jgi:hypothetical protein
MPYTILQECKSVLRSIKTTASKRTHSGMPLPSLLLMIELEAERQIERIEEFQSLKETNDNAQQGDD